MSPPSSDPLSMPVPDPSPHEEHMDSAEHPSAKPPPPLHLWLITLNREVSPWEYDVCLSRIDPDDQERAETIANKDEAFRFILTRLLTVLIMQNNLRLRRENWRLNSNKAGKLYIEMQTPKGLKMTGFESSSCGSLVAMAFAHGSKGNVINTGVDLMQIMSPKGVSMDTYLQSYIHKLTSKEAEMLDRNLKADVILRRLCVLITLKNAYIKALGQPPGFDYSRIYVDVPGETVSVDGVPLVGWEFRLSKANLGVMRKGILLEETYQCSCAIYRPHWSETRFEWGEEPEMGRWMTFINMESVIEAVAPRDKHGKVAYPRSELGSGSGSNPGSASGSKAPTPRASNTPCSTSMVRSVR